MKFQCFVCVVRDSGDLPTPVQTVIDKEMQKIYCGKDPKTLNEEFLSRNKNSLEHLLAGELYSDVFYISLLCYYSYGENIYVDCRVLL